MILSNFAHLPALFEFVAFLLLGIGHELASTLTILLG
jgi:hypothetical protein